jgi:hypothetical protein
MTAGDPTPSDEGDKASPSPNKPDVRVSSHEDMGVHVERDLRATGPTARGFNSNMSKLSFSSRGLRRDEIADEEPAPPTPAASTSAATPSSVQPAAAPESPESGGALSWLTGLFSRR